MCIYIYIIVIIYKIPWISIYWIDKYIYIYTPIYTKWKGWFNQRPQQQQQQQRVLEGYHGEMGSIDLENPQFRKMMEMWSIGGFWTDLYIIYSSLASLSQFVVHPIIHEKVWFSHESQPQSDSWKSISHSVQIDPDKIVM